MSAKIIDSAKADGLVVSARSTETVSSSFLVVKKYSIVLSWAHTIFYQCVDIDCSL